MARKVFRDYKIFWLSEEIDEFNHCSLSPSKLKNEILKNYLRIVKKPDNSQNTNLVDISSKLVLKEKK